MSFITMSFRPKKTYRAPLHGRRKAANQMMQYCGTLHQMTDGLISYADRVPPMSSFTSAAKLFKKGALYKQISHFNIILYTNFPIISFFGSIPLFRHMSASQDRHNPRRSILSNLYASCYTFRLLQPRL